MSMAVASGAALTVLTLGAQFQLFGLAGFDDTTAAHTPLEWLAAAAILTGIGLALLRVAARASRLDS